MSEDKYKALSADIANIMQQGNDLRAQWQSAQFHNPIAAAAEALAQEEQAQNDSAADEDVNEED